MPWRGRDERVTREEGDVPPILETRGLRKVYGAGALPVVAVDGVDVSIAAGEFVAVMGASGCGKSTLLHLLGGLDRPTAGELYFNGERVDGLSEAAWARRRRHDVGYVFQFFNLIPNLSVADNVELPGLIAGLSAGEARTRRTHLLHELGIADRAHEPPARISGGEQQRVAIARALINEPAVLLADEPTGNLDTRTAGEVMELLAQRNRNGQTIVMVTHDVSVAAAAHRCLTMRDGRVVDDAPTPQREVETLAAAGAATAGR